MAPLPLLTSSAPGSLPASNGRQMPPPGSACSAWNSCLGCPAAASGTCQVHSPQSWAGATPSAAAITAAVSIARRRVEEYTETGGVSRSSAASRWPSFSACSRPGAVKPRQPCGPPNVPSTPDTDSACRTDSKRVSAGPKITSVAGRLPSPPARRDSGRKPTTPGRLAAGSCCRPAARQRRRSAP